MASWEAAALGVVVALLTIALLAAGAGNGDDAGLLLGVAALVSVGALEVRRRRRG